MLLEHELTNQILGAAIEVHKALGPGLLESAYEECLCHELDERGLSFERQVDQISRPPPLLRIRGSSWIAAIVWISWSRMQSSLS